MRKSNLAPLADEYGELKHQIGLLETKLSAIKSTLLEAGIDALEGQFYSVKVNRTVQERISPEAVRAILTLAELEEVTRHVEVITLRATPIFGAKFKGAA